MPATSAAMEMSTATAGKSVAAAITKLTTATSSAAYPARWPYRTTRAMRARRATTGSGPFTTRPNRCSRTRRRGAPGRSAREKSRRATSRLVSSTAGSGARSHIATSPGSSTLKTRKPARISSSTGYRCTASGRRATTDSITGLPKPSHVEGKTTTSAAA